MRLAFLLPVFVVPVRDEFVVLLNLDDVTPHTITDRGFRCMCHSIS